MTKAHWRIIPSRIGWTGLAATSDGLCRLRFRCSPDELVSDIRSFGLEPSQGGGRIDEAADQLEEYLAGDRRRFSFPVNFVVGTVFQRRVWEATQAVQYGMTRSYQDIAGDIGRPRAAMPVGQAMGANPVPIFCPCHRIIRNDGSVGGFSADPDIKRSLLGLEAKVRAAS